MKRGSVVIATAAGFGTKPRPWVVIQAAGYLDIGTLILIPLTSELANPPSPLRPSIAPNADNGLRDVSEAMTNLPIAIRSDKIHQQIGTLARVDIGRIEQALVLILGIEGRAT